MPSLGSIEGCQHALAPVPIDLFFGGPRDTVPEEVTECSQSQSTETLAANWHGPQGSFSSYTQGLKMSKDVQKCLKKSKDP